MFLAKKLNNGAGSPAAPADAQFNYVTMLLHGDGTNGAQNNTFLDSSTNNFTITRNGNTTQGSFSPYGSNWSNNFSTTSGNYLTIANNAAFTLGSTFTVECWVYRTASNDGTIVGRWYAGNSSGWLMHIYNTGKLAFGTGDGSYANSSVASIPLNTWTHVAVSNNTTSKRFYINGVLDSTFASDDINSLGSNNLTICQNTGGGNGITAYISNLRIVKGTALYTSNFTPSTTPLTAVSGTSLLTCQSNRFIDNSTNNFAITVTGAPSVQRFNPFGASTAYSTSVIGGSGYFDGSGDYLTSSCGNVGTGDFTIEGWFYFRTTPSTMGLFQASSTSGGFAPNQTANLAVATGSSSTWQIYAKNTFTTSSSTSVPVNAWGHMALVRSGTTTVLYINGAVVITLTSDSTNYSTSFIGLGGIYDNSSYLLNGYLSNFRVVVGTAVYTSAFTPPTAPVTAISGTALLCNMTNGAIFDNAMMNDLETVGNAQISTSVVKYGTGSLAFDGTGDYLKVPASPNLIFGTGDFTIECWIYVSSNPAQFTAIVSNWAGADPAWILDFSNGSGNIRFNDNGNVYLTSSSTLTTGQWNHVAVSRSGTSLKMFFNGTSVATATNSTSFGSASAGVFVGAYYDGTYALNGYIDDLRITKGYARYTATFTPPTAAFPNIGPY